MGSRKRTRSEIMPSPDEQPTEEPGLLQRLRNTWEFACLMQYIAIFGQVMKIDEEFEMEDLENECMKPEPSQKLLEIGLCLLKWISSHRGLTVDNFDEYTRRQYNAKAPHVVNPFGQEEEPLKFMDFDVFLKVRVLHQLSVWTFWNPDRIRDKMPEKKENEQLQWRIEEFGYDREGRAYYVLDDNRLYRRTDPPIPTTQRPKKKPKSRSSRNSRASKRASRAAVEEETEEENQDPADSATGDPEPKWECVAVTLTEYNEFLDTIRKSKDPDEKGLRSQIEEHVLPLLEKAEEALQRKRMKREKEELALHMIAGAKRSSRLAGKFEKERAEREAAEAARKHEADLAEARREQAKQEQREGDRQSRMMTREQRIKDREQKRILHEAELERIADEQEKVNRGESRSSARHLQVELEKSQRNLADLSQDDQWIFDCSGCGVYGENLDDGSHSVACEKCNVWQHSSCLGIRKEDAEKEDFHFVCQDCKQKEERANLPKIPPLKFRLSSSASPSAVPPTGQKRKLEEDDDLPPPSPVKRTHTALSSVQDGVVLPHTSEPKPASLGVESGFSVPRSPERRVHPSSHTSLPSSSPPRPTFSPPKGAYGPAHAMPGQHALPPMQPAPQLPPLGPFHAARPSSSHSGHGPIQNQPSMSPTQGNHDVGPLAGFPHTTASNGNSAYSSFESYATPRPQSGHATTPAMSSHYPSFSAQATPNGNHSSPPHSSHGMGLSGISPTKQSPRPMTSGHNGPGAVVLPPIRRLEPSPKLMGRSSPDAPIPPPVKCMTPEQEERRQRENASLAQPGPHYPANGQPTLMSSPSLNRIPSLGAAANAVPEPVPSPQRGGNDSRQ
ncbi:hypothetical protein N7492_001265 [Penicillium capsulatum]|uniref:Zinc finger PHD-type domain-containing protein n=1 Tax=Penicillium capsulatum TaxID=69766 RepID=A0A9W9ITC5_9EURO|nr:hypothetical protein N7492_001265 [Penicillium capsulatum]KAJ6129677.1 hypothetical protein N7512_002457 [Penicillium capsulatum]